MNDLHLFYSNPQMASLFQMPEEYMSQSLACVLIYPGDESWHRGEIVHIYDKKVQVKISDYGDKIEVPFERLHFMYFLFNELSKQAIQCSFFNIKRTNQLPPHTIRYLLNRLQDKLLEAKIVGVHNNCFSVQLYGQTTSQSANGCPRGTKIYLNNRVIVDGFGQFKDETKKLNVN
jgi:hypothetical protein